MSYIVKILETATQLISGLMPEGKLNNWDNAYLDRLNWDGGAINLISTTGRTSLGLGTIATQDYNNISITGGNISGAALSNITSLDVSSYMALAWATQGNDNLQLGLSVGNVLYSGYFNLMRKEDMNNANRSPTDTTLNPKLRIYSGDVAEAQDYIDIYHNQDAGIIYCPSGLIFSATAGKMIIQDSSKVLNFGGNSTFGQTIFSPEDAGGNQIIITTDPNWYADHDHALQSDPTLFIHSNLSPDVSNNQYAGFNHDKTNFNIFTGANVGVGSVPTTIDNAIIISPRTVEAGRFDSDATARNTRFMLYDIDNGQMERVSVGEQNSGGVGFKLLRIAN